MGARQSVECDLKHLIDLTRKGNIEELEQCLEEKRFQQAVNVRDTDGWTPLHWASSFKSSVIPVLLKHGADVHIQDNDGSTPLHLACRNCKTKGTRTLINAGANVNGEDKFKRTPLHRAARFGTALSIKMLVVSGAEVDHPDKDNKTPLYFAAYARRSDNVKILLDNDAFVHHNDLLNNSPFTITQKYFEDHQGKGPSSRIMKLLQKANPTESKVPSLKQLCRTFIQQNRDEIKPQSDDIPKELFRYLGFHCAQ